MKAKKTNNQNVDGSVEQEMIQQNSSPMMMGQAENASGNTISERERISRLRQELNGLDFSKIAAADEDGTLEQQQNLQNDETFETTEELRASIKQDEADLNLELEQLERAKQAIGRSEQPAKVAPTPKKENSANIPVANNGPVDPYKQTILPRNRRRNIDSNKYANPIGNTAEKITNHSAPRSANREINTADYKDKIFLGDSDRI